MPDEQAAKQIARQGMSGNQLAMLDRWKVEVGNVVGVPGSGSAVRYVPPNKMPIGRP